MITKPAFLNELADHVAALAAATPAKDIQNNLRAFLSSTFARLDLVPREEFELQREALRLARDRLTALEAKVATLEQRRV